MEFAHAFDDCLTGIRVGRNFERRIFHRQSGQSQPHFLDVGLGLRFDSQFNNRFGENHVFQNNRLRGVTQRIAGGRVFQTGQSDNVAGMSLFQIFTLVRMHQQHAADTLFFVFNRVVNI